MPNKMGLPPASLVFELHVCNREANRAPPGQEPFLGKSSWFSTKRPLAPAWIRVYRWGRFIPAFGAAGYKFPASDNPGRNLSLAGHNVGGNWAARRARTRAAISAIPQTASPVDMPHGLPHALGPALEAPSARRKRRTLALHLRSRATLPRKCNSALSRESSTRASCKGLTISNQRR